MFEDGLDFDLNKLTACIIAVNINNTGHNEFIQSIEEISQLSQTLGIHIDALFTQQRKTADSAFFAGKGKIDEILTYISDKKVDLIIFDNDISGIQERNLEKYTGKKIYDRTGIILEIFKKRARSNEAKLQVELAAMEYMLPRLKHLWTHFSRSEGIVGIRGGEGEKQIELDKRIIKNRITQIKNKLKKIEVQSNTRRKKREDSFTISLVGYTNAGKSSLMNVLSKQNLLSENMLFSTIDSTIRKVYINDSLTVLLNDTVGFINKLPHSLVASFKSTLDEIKTSSLLLHVIDSSSDYIETHIRAVNEVLKEINACNIPVIRVFNKIDLLEDPYKGISIPKSNNDVFISTYTKTGIDELKDLISSYFQ